MDKEIAQENMEDELEVYVGRPYSGEHNKIPKSKQSEKEEETKEEKEEGDQEPETKAEVIRRTEDPIGTKETDNSPVFDITAIWSGYRASPKPGSRLLCRRRGPS